VYKYLENIWNKTTARTRLTRTEKLFFWILCFSELFYRSIFYLINNFKRALACKRSSFFYVISVGNLSVGGTGKSVFVQFLVHVLDNKTGNKNCAVILRGYKSKLEKTGNSFLVSDGNTIFYDVTQAGDEALMLAHNVHVPIVIGPNRAKSCEILEAWYESNGAQLSPKRTGRVAVRPDGGPEVRVEGAERHYLILDDAYQHHTLKKNLEILLLDARHPFENNHCLPAGRLREKDYSRADIIILTHADTIDSQALERIKKEKFTLFDQTKIFSGKHVVQGIYYHNDEKSSAWFETSRCSSSPRALLKSSLALRSVLSESKDASRMGASSTKALVFAGIGSFSNFVYTVEESGFIISQTIEYQDHYSYTKQDLEKIIDILQEHKLTIAITTSKDWCKLEPILKQYDLQIPIYVLRVGFEFLSPREYDDFMKVFIQ